ncbi:hypothetical protein, partial [Lishizhenia sp.]|uniref:hypothetical protein n=1 Tax=Lishizhenia sp. TaxID=2497594 RepID=UPI00299D9836
MGYGGPNSTVFEPEVLVIGPDKVEVNEEFTLTPRHIYKDMWEVYEIEFGGKVRDGKFIITKDTIISGHFKIMKRNGVWMRIPFQKEVYIR